MSKLAYHELLDMMFSGSEESEVGKKSNEGYEGESPKRLHFLLHCEKLYVGDL